MLQLRNAMKRGWISAEGMEQAGRIVVKHLKDSDQKPLRVLLLGQCTTSWLGSCLSAAAWAGGTGLIATEGQYDNVFQELLSASASGSWDAVIFLPWNNRLFGATDRSAQERVDDELAFWQQSWRIVTDQLKSRLIQIGYDWVTPGPLGYHLGRRSEGPVALVHRANDALRAAFPPSGFFVDLDQISGTAGREKFYDPRRYHWTKQPFSEVGVAKLADHLWASLRAMIFGPKKVLVLDLDNTIWGGVVGETGPLGIEIGDSPSGEAYRSLQSYAKALSRRGCVLAVCSKNNPADAREPFEQNPGMVLALDDIAAFEASWDPKAVAIRRIAQTLQLGLDSFVFVDDNPAEREHVRQMLPEVEVVEMPLEPSEYVRAIEGGLWFEAVSLTAADTERAQQYLLEAKRREISTQFTSMEDYLQSLDMVADARPINEEDLPRVVQLIGKTNQFNLTTRRHSTEVVERMMHDPNTVSFTVRLRDRFGDYGLVALLIAATDPDMDARVLKIDTWLMSCRVIGRTVEEYCLNAIVEAARSRSVTRLIGQYIPTKKNGLVKDLFDRLGFENLGESEDGAVHYELDLSDVNPSRTFIKTTGLPE